MKINHLHHRGAALRGISPRRASIGAAVELSARAKPGVLPMNELLDGPAGAAGLERRRRWSRAVADVARRAASPPAPCAARSPASRAPPAATATSRLKDAGRRRGACAARCSGALRSCSTSLPADGQRGRAARPPGGLRAARRAAVRRRGDAAQRRRRALRAVPAAAARLEAEGLFDAGARSGRCRRFRAAIGVVTSLGGAALHDVATTLARRSPHVARGRLSEPGAGRRRAGGAVRGDRDAPAARAEVDVLIVCRGGGSLEDLWAFNDERVVRAIARRADAGGERRRPRDRRHPGRPRRRPARADADGRGRAGRAGDRARRSSCSMRIAPRSSRRTRSGAGARGAAARPDRPAPGAAERDAGAARPRRSTCSRSASAPAPRRDAGAAPRRDRCRRGARAQPASRARWRAQARRASTSAAIRLGRGRSAAGCWRAATRCSRDARRPCRVTSVGAAAAGPGRAGDAARTATPALEVRSVVPAAAAP